MVAIITGNQLGLFGTSATTLGSGGMSGDPTTGRSGEKAYVNTATGNVILQNVDERVSALGLDIGLVRTYNSQGGWDGDNSDNFHLGIYEQIHALTGTVNMSGSTVKKTFGDGSDVLYTYNTALGKYVSTDGDGANDTLLYTPAAGTTPAKWTWTDGTNRNTETYDWIGSGNATTGKLLNSKDADGNTVTYGYTGALLTSVTDQSGQVTTLVYTGNNLTQIKVTQPAAQGGAVQSLVYYAYDANGRLTTVTVDLSPGDNSITDGNTYTTTYTYDPADTTNKRVASITQKDGSSVGFAYQLINGQYRVTKQTVTSATGATRLTTYAYTFDTTNTYIQQTDVTVDPTSVNPSGLNLVTTYKQDAKGRLIAILSPTVGSNRLEVDYTYDPTSGNVQTVTEDPNGLKRVTTYQYDSNGNLILTRDVAGNTVARFYDTTNTNQLLAEAKFLTPDPDGSGSGQPSNSLTTRYVYDAEFHLRFVIDADGRVTEHQYDASGNMTLTRRFTGGVYNVGALAASTATAAVTLTEAQMTTWLGSQDLTNVELTQYAYDFRGNVQTQTQWTTTDASGNGASTPSVTTFVYDQRGQLLQTVSPRGTPTLSTTDYLTTYTYDGLGRVLSKTEGNVAAGYDNTGVACYVYATPTPNTVPLYWLYQPVTKYSLYTASASEVQSAQVSHGFVLKGITGYVYDPNATPPASTTPLYRITYGGTGLHIYTVSTTTRDAILASNVNYVSEGIACYVYTNTAPGPSGTVPLVQLHRGVADYLYMTSNDEIQAYLAGNQYRVTTYQYDDVGNRTTTTAANGLVTTATYNKAGEVTSVVSTGRDIAIGATTYSYDADGRLKMVTDPNGVRTFTLYDAASRKVGSVDGNGTLTEYVYDNAGEVVKTIRYATAVSTGFFTPGGTNALLDASGNPTNVALATIRPTVSVNDQISRAVYNSAGQVVYTVDPRGFVTESRYDGAGRVTDVIRYVIDLRDNGVPPVAIAASVGELRLNGTAGQLVDPATGKIYVVRPDTDSLNPSANQLNDRHTRYFYNNAGQVWAVLDAAGYLTENVYDGSGQLTQTIAYSSPTYAAYRATGTVVQLRPVYDPTPGGVTIDGLTVTKTGGANGAWDSGFRSNVGYSGAASVSFSAAQRNQYVMVGLNTDPAKDNSYTSIDYAMYCTASGTLQAYENGVLAQTFGNYATTDVLSVTYDGSTIRYLQNGVVLRSVTVAIAQPLYADSSFYGLGGKVQNVQFTPGTLSRIVTNPTSQNVISYFFYDGEGRQVGSLGAEGYFTEKQYDVDGNLTRTLKFDRALTLDTFANLQTNARATTTTVAVHGVSYQYDGLDRRIREAMLVGTTAAPALADLGEVSVTTYVYDVIDHLVSSTVAQGTADERTTKTRYDALGRVTRKLSGEGSKALAALPANATQVQIDAVWSQYGLTYTYDKAGNRITETDASGNTTTFYYDQDNHLRYTINALGEVTENKYNVLGQLTDVIHYTNRLTTPIGSSPSVLVSGASTAVTFAKSAFDVNGNGIVIYVQGGKLYARMYVKSTDSWGGVLTIDANTNVTLPNLSVSANGNALITWLQGGHVRAMRYVNGAWSAIEVIENAANPAQGPAGSINDAGRAMIAYIQSDGTLNNVMASGYNGTSWSTPTAIDDNSYYYHAVNNNSVTSIDPPDVAVDTQGNGYVVWNQPSANAYDALIQNRYDAATNTWMGASQYLGNPNGPVTASGVALNDKGHGIVYYATNKYTGTQPDVFAADIFTQSDMPAKNSGWPGLLDFEALQLAAVDITGPVNLSVSPDGNTTGVSSNSIQQDLNALVTVAEVAGIQASVRIGGVWSTPVIPNTVGATNAAGSINAGGQAAVIFAQGGHLYISRWQSNAWTTPALLDNSANAVVAAVPSVSIDPSGNVNATWLQPTNSGDAGASLYAVQNKGFFGGAVTATLKSAVDALASPNQDAHISYTYTTADLVATQTTTLNATDTGLTSYQYDAFGEQKVITQKIDATHTRTSSLTYDVRGLLTSSTVDATGLAMTTSNTYDSFGRLRTATDARGNVVSYEYDRLGRTVATVDAMSGRTVTTYDAFDRILTVRDALYSNTNDTTTTYSYNDATRSVTITTPEKMSITTTQNAEGQDLIVTAAGNTTRYTYDANGNVTKITDSVSEAAGSVPLESRSYDSAGREVSETDARGIVTKFTYDAANRVLTRTVDPTTNGLNLITSYQYDGQGRVMLVTEPSGRVIKKDYDNDGRVTQVTIDPNGLKLATTYTYDFEGHTLTVTEGSGSVTARTTQYVYDTLGRRTQTISDPGAGHLNLTTTYKYDSNGNVIRKIDANGNSTWYVYDASNRPIFTIDALGDVTETTYDADNRVVGTRAYFNQINVANFTVGGVVADQISIARSPTSATIQVAGGTVMTLIPTVSDNVIQTVYDKDGRVRYTINGVGTVTEFTYDSVSGKVARTRVYANAIPVGLATYPTVASVQGALTISPNDRVSFTDYDARGRMIFTIDGVGAVVQYQYDADDNVVMKTAYASLYGITAPMDATKIQAWLSSIDITVAGGATTVAGNAANQVTRYWYDSLNRQRFVLDGEGYLHETRYNDAARTHTTVTYAAKPTITATAVLTDVVKAAATIANTANDRQLVTLMDVAGRVSQITDGEGYITKYFYDAEGNVIETDRALDLAATQWQKTYRYYDNANRQIFEIDGEGCLTGMQYDAVGNVKARMAYGRVATVPPAGSYPTPAANSAGNVTRYSYDADNRLTRKSRELVTYQTTLSSYTVQSGDKDWSSIAVAIYGVQVLGDYGTKAALSEELPAALGYGLTTIPAVGTVLKPPASLTDVVNTDYQYDAHGNIKSKTEASGTLDARTTVYVYDAADRLTDTTAAYNSANAVTTHLTLDAFGNVTTRAEAYQTGDERDLTYQYDGDNRVYLQSNGLTSTNGGMTFTVFDAFGNVHARAVAASTADQRTTTYAYDHNNQLLSETDAAGGTTSYAYDAAGNRTFVISPDAIPLTTQDDAPGVAGYYMAWRQRLGIVDANGKGLTAAQFQALSPTVQAQYVAKIVMATGTQYSYDRNSRLVLVTQPLNNATDTKGVQTKYVYDGVGNKTDVYQAYGLTGQERHTRYTYYNTNRIKSVTDPMGGVTTYAYDAVGHEIQVVNANNVVINKGYDALGHLMTVLQPRGGGGIGNSTLPMEITQYQYDNRGNIISSRQCWPNGTDARITTYSYDLLDRQTVATDGEGFSTVTVYDKRGNKKTVVSGVYALSPGMQGYDASKAARAFGIGMNYDYDLANRMIDSTDGVGSMTKYDYDGAGNLKDTIAAQNTLFNTVSRETIYTYDGANRVIRVDTPAGGQTLYTYDLSGNKISEQHLQRAYYRIQSSDTWDSIAGKVYTSTSGITGTMLQAQMGVGNTTPTAGAYLSIPTVVGGKSASLNTSALANAAYTTHTFEYNGRGENTAELDSYQTRTEYSYDAVGNRTKVSFAVGAAEARSAAFKYDLNNRKTDDIDGNSVVTAHYDYDAMGNVVKVTKPSQWNPAGDAVRYYYNAANQLSMVVGPARYVYYTDANGNGQIGNGSVINTFTYDSSGNRVQERVYMTPYIGAVDTSTPPVPPMPSASSSDRIVTRVYDKANHLISRTDADGTRTELVYDGAGNVLQEWDYANAAVYSVPSGATWQTVANTLYGVNSAAAGTALAGQMGGAAAPSGTLANLPKILTVSGVNYNLNLVRLKAYTYDSDGRMKTFADVDGVVTTFYYDAVGNKVRQEVVDSKDVMNPMRRTAYGYDLDNRLAVTVYDPTSDLATHQQFDPNRIGLDLTHRTIYDRVGNVIAEVDGLHNNGEEYWGAFPKYYQYDLNNRRVAEAQSMGFIAAPVASGAYTPWADNPYFDAAVAALTFAPPTSDPSTRYGYDRIGNRTTSISANVSGLLNSNDAYYVNGRQRLGIVYSSGDVGKSVGQGKAAGDLTAADVLALISFCTTTYYYDLNNRQTRVSQPLSEVYNLGANGSWSDQSASPTTLNYYDANGNLIESDRGTATGTDAAAKMTTITAPTTNYYDGENRLIARVDGNNSLCTYVYDAAGNLAQKTEYATPMTALRNTTVLPSVMAMGGASGDRVTTYQYDLGNRLVQTTLPAIDVTTLESTSGYSRGTVSVGPGAVAGTLAVTVNLSAQEAALIKLAMHLTYRVAGSTGAFTDVVLSASPDGTPGKFVQTMSGLAANTNYEFKVSYFDTSGLEVLLEHQTVLSNITSLVNFQFMTSIASQVKLTEKHVYNLYGDEIETDDRAGNRTLNYYDVMHRKIASVDPLYYLTEWDYDHLGNQRSQRRYTQTLNTAIVLTAGGIAPTMPAGSPVYRTDRYYNVASWLVSEVGPAIDVFNPDKNTYTQGDRPITSYIYDATGHQVAKTTGLLLLAGGAAADTDNSTAVTQYAYYDPTGHVALSLDSSGVPTLYTYDLDGNLISTRRYWAQPSGWPVLLRQNSTAVGIDEQYYYHLLGGTSLQSSVTSNIASAPGYNASNDVVVNYQYDTLDRLISKTDSMSLPNQNDDLSQSYKYDQDGNRTYIKDEDGYVSKNAYDANRHVVDTEIDKSNGTVSMNSVFRYDAFGNMTLGYASDPSAASLSKPSDAYPPLPLSTALANGQLTINWSVANASRVQTWIVYTNNANNSQPGAANLSSYTLSTPLVNSPNGLASASIAAAAGSVFYYRIVTRDGAGNLAWTAEQTAKVNGSTLSAFMTPASVSGGMTPDGKASTFYFTQATYNALNYKINSNEKDGSYREFGVDAMGHAVVTTNYGLPGDNDSPPITTYAAYDARGRLIADVQPAVATPDSTYTVPSGATWTMVANNLYLPSAADVNAITSQLATYYKSSTSTLPTGTLANLPLVMVAKNATTGAFNTYHLVAGAVSSQRPVTRYKYDVNDNVIGKESPNPQTGADFDYATYQYNSANEQVVQTQASSAGSATTRTFYDQFGNVTAISTPNLEGKVANNTGAVRKSYDLQGHLIKEVDVLGNVKTYTYDLFGRKVSMTDGRGYAITHFDTDPAGIGYVLLRQNLGVIYKSGDKNSTGQPLGSGKRVADLTQNDINFLSQFYTTRYTYDNRDRLTSVETPEGMQLGYDNGEVYKGDGTTVYQGERQRLGFAADAYQLSASDRQTLRALYTTSYKYDGRGDRIQTAPGDVLIGGVTTNVVYDELKRVTNTQLFVKVNVDTSTSDPFQPNGATDNTTYLNGSVSTYIDAAGHTRTYTYGSFGQLLQDKAPTNPDGSAGAVTNYTYDQFGRVVKQQGTSADGKPQLIVTTYDAAGRVITIDDQKMQIRTDYSYYLSGQRYQEIVTNTSTGKTLSSVTYTYDSAGHMTRWSDTWSDPVTAVDSPNSITSIQLNYKYDLDGNVTEVYTDTGWDPTGANATAKNPNYRYYDHKYSYYYNPTNPVLTSDILGTEMSVSTDSSGHSVSSIMNDYKYDEAGNRVWWHDGNGQVTWTYTLDANGRVATGISDGSTNQYWQYDPEGHITFFGVSTPTPGAIGKSFTKSTTTKYRDGLQYQVSSKSSGNPDQSSTYQYDLAGHVQTMTVATTGQGSNTFTYSYYGDGREKSVSSSTGLSKSLYDANGHYQEFDPGKTSDLARNPFSGFVNDNEGHILTRTRDDGVANDGIETHQYIYANGNPVAAIGKNANGKLYLWIEPQSSTDLQTYNIVHNINDSTPGTIRTYVVHANDTLQSVASALYGDPSLWYVIADANGLQSSTALTTGFTLTIPNTMQFGQLTADTHVVYDQAGLVGSTLPNLEPPPPRNPSECAMIAATIITVAIAVVATYLTAGAAAAVMPTVGASALDVIGSLTVAAGTGAVIHGVADVASQTVRMGFGLQQNFNWSEVGHSAAAGAASGVATGIDAYAESSAAAGLSSGRGWAIAGSAAFQGGASVLSSYANGGGAWSAVAGAATGGVAGYLGASTTIGKGENSFAEAERSLAIAQNSPAAVRAADSTISSVNDSLNALHALSFGNRFLSPWVNYVAAQADYDHLSAEQKQNRAPPNPFNMLGSTLAVVGESAIETQLDQGSFSDNLRDSGIGLALTGLVAGVASIHGAATAQQRAQIIGGGIGGEIGNFIGYSLLSNNSSSAAPTVTTSQSSSTSRQEYMMNVLAKMNAQGIISDEAYYDKAYEVQGDDAPSNDDFNAWVSANVNESQRGSLVSMPRPPGLLSNPNLQAQMTKEEFAKRALLNWQDAQTSWDEYQRAYANALKRNASGEWNSDSPARVFIDAPSGPIYYWQSGPMSPYIKPDTLRGRPDQSSYGAYGEEDFAYQSNDPGLSVLATRAPEILSLESRPDSSEDINSKSAESGSGTQITFTDTALEPARVKADMQSLVADAMSSAGAKMTSLPPLKTYKSPSRPTYYVVPGLGLAPVPQPVVHENPYLVTLLYNKILGPIVEFITGRDVSNPGIHGIETIPSSFWPIPPQAPPGAPGPQPSTAPPAPQPAAPQLTPEEELQWLFGATAPDGGVPGVPHPRLYPGVPNLRSVALCEPASPVDASWEMRRSPTLREQLDGLRQIGWKIIYVPRENLDGAAGETVREDKIIKIDQNLYGDIRELRTLAHEAGHAMLEFPLGSKEAHIDNFVINSLADDAYAAALKGQPFTAWDAEGFKHYAHALSADEGAGIINEERVLREVMENKQASYDFGPSEDSGLYDEYLKAQTGRERRFVEAEIGDRFTAKYGDGYLKEYRQNWDAWKGYYLGPAWGAFQSRMIGGSAQLVLGEGQASPTQIWSGDPRALMDSFYGK